MKMTKKDMEQIASEFNQKFGEPFLRKGDVTVQVLSETEYFSSGAEQTPEDKIDEKYILSFNIGRRDVQFDENFDCISAGTFIG